MRIRKLVIVSIFLMSTIGLFSQNKLVLSHSGSDHPFYQQCVDIVIEAYGRLGITVEFKELPLERSAVVANQGAVDGELFRGEIDPSHYPNLIKVPIPITAGELCAFTKGLTFDVVGWESLRPYKIGTQTGLKPAEIGTSGMNVKKVTEGSQLMKMLAAGRLEVIILPRDVGERDIIDAGVSGIQVLEPPVQIDYIYHYVNKKHEALIPQLTKILEDMQAEGKIIKLN